MRFSITIDFKFLADRIYNFQYCFSYMIKLKMSEGDKAKTCEYREVIFQEKISKKEAKLKFSGEVFVLVRDIFV
jgi:hypothetical protein